jgi:hypothetical protein
LKIHYDSERFPGFDSRRYPAIGPARLSRLEQNQLPFMCRLAYLVATGSSRSLSVSPETEVQACALQARPCEPRFALQARSPDRSPFARFGNERKYAEQLIDFIDIFIRVWRDFRLCNSAGRSGSENPI